MLTKSRLLYPSNGLCQPQYTLSSLCPTAGVQVSLLSIYYSFVYEIDLRLQFANVDGLPF